MAEKMKEESKDPLTVELLQVGEFLFGRIKDQDDTLRMGSLQFEHEGVRILSAGTPQLYLDNCKLLTLYIRGSDRRNDHMTFMYKFKSEKDAIKWGSKLKNAIEVFNKDPMMKPEIPTEPLRCKRIMG